MAIDIPVIPTIVNNSWGASNVTTGLDFFKQTLTETPIFGIYFLLPIIILVLSLFMITRVPNQWKILAFPLTVGWHTVGLQMPLTLFFITGIIFTIETVSLQTFQRAIGTISGSITGGVSRNITREQRGERLQGIKDFFKPSTAERREENKKRADRIQAKLEDLAVAKRFRDEEKTVVDPATGERVKKTQKVSKN